MQKGNAMGGMSVMLWGLLMTWGATPGGSAAAPEKVPPKIPQAKSYVLTMVQQPAVDSTLPAVTAKVYWTAPGKFRFEAYDGSELLETKISSTSGPGIDINHEHKTYQTLPAEPGSPQMRFFNEGLGRFAGQADRDLGARQIGDSPARGFEIGMAKIDPDLPPGTTRIWVDRQSGLPVEIEYTFETGGEIVAVRFKDIRWNVDLDPKLFEPVAPSGYVKRSRSLPPMEEQLRRIVQALRIYAELFGGHYPGVTRVYADVLRDEMFKKVGIHGAAPTWKQKRSDEYKNVLDATNGFTWLSRILEEVPDAAYYGKTVGPNDKNKVLVRWKLDAGKYQVIYGDLRTETVTAEKLRSLEGATGLALFEAGDSAGVPADESSREKSLPRMPNFTFDRIPACHWRKESYSTPSGKEAKGEPKMARVEEGWAVRDVGWRVEVRKGSELTSVVVQTPRWRFSWDVVGNVVSASPGTSRKPANNLLIRSRREIMRNYEQLRPTFVSEKEHQDGREIEKITFRFLADPEKDGDWPIHSFHPETHSKLLQSPDAEFRTRTYWFDAKTHLVTGYRCGCRTPKTEYWIDYPAPESVARELFTFQVPRDATLEIDDPELGRPVLSNGQTGPDLRQ